MQLIGILGGTFDPIHNGHIRLALEAREQLELDQVRLIPLNIPPHRTPPVANALHRQTMIELAIENEPKLCIDLREIESNDISYTINTLKSLRQEYIEDTLYLIVGRDAFNKIDSWKNWEQLLDFTHIIVANRPGEANNELPIKLQDWIKQFEVNDISLLQNNTNGYIYFISIPMLDISSSMIRQLYSTYKTVDDLLPIATQTYIKENELYLDTA